MGLLDLLRGDGGFKKHAARVANKRAQAPDRWESIVALSKMKSEEAVRALLRRFSYRIDPSITDQEEKEAAFQGVIGAGAVAVGPVRDLLRESDSVSWPLKILERLLATDEVVTELLAVVEDMDTDYARDPEKKIQAVGYLAERTDPRIVNAVCRFLEDTNDTVRFQAITALLRQESAEDARPALLDAVLSEDSVRNRVAILDGFAAHSWDVGEQLEQVRLCLPDGFALDSGGVPRKS